MLPEGHGIRHWIVPILAGIGAFVILLIPLYVAMWLVPPTERTITVIDLRGRFGTIDTTDLKAVLAANGSGPSTLLMLVSPDGQDVPGCSRPEDASLCGLRQTFPHAAFIASNLSPRQLLVASGADPSTIAATRGVFHAAIRESTSGRTAVAAVMAAILALVVFAIFTWTWFRRDPVARPVRERRVDASRSRRHAPRTPTNTPPPPQSGPTRGWQGVTGVPEPIPRWSPPADPAPPRGSVPLSPAPPGPAPVGGQPPRTAPTRPGQAPRHPTQAVMPAAVAPPMAPRDPSAPQARTFVDANGGYVELNGIVVWAVLAPTEATAIEPEEPVAIVSGGADEPLLIARAHSRRPSETADPGRKP